MDLARKPRIEKVWEPLRYANGAGHYKMAVLDSNDMADILLIRRNFCALTGVFILGLEFRT